MSVCQSPSTDRRQDFYAHLDSLENLAAIRRDLAHTRNTSNAPALSTLIAKNSAALHQIYLGGYYVTPEDFDRIVALMSNFGQGYDDCGGLEYETFEDLDRILVAEIREWSRLLSEGKIKLKLKAWSAIRASMKASDTSAAHLLDGLIKLGLEMEVEYTKTSSKVSDGLCGACDALAN